MSTNENKPTVRSELYCGWMMRITISVAFATAFLLSPARTARADVFSSDAVLSNDLVVTGHPITYVVDFGVSFSSISEVDYLFTFGDDPLDTGECLDFTGDFPGGFGFCNPGATPQTSRLLTFPCSIHPSVCDAFRDGASGGQMTASRFTGSGAASVRITLVRVTIQGAIAVIVDIDIKPGSFPNSINPKSQGVIPVAILTTDSFDATTVDPTTVLFGRTGTEAAPVHSALEDVDGDGDTDMILHFKTQETGIVCGNTSASLTGETFSGQMIEGSDSIRTVGCK